MGINDGNGTVVEPNAPAGAAGMEPQGSALPENNQSNGEGTQKSEGSTAPGWMAQLPNDLKVNTDLQKYATLADFVRSTQTVESDGNEGDGDHTSRKTEPVKYEKFEKSLGDDSDPFGLIGTSMREVLESSQVPQEVAEKVFDKLAESHSGTTRQMIEKGKDWCEAQLKTDKWWGADYEENRKAMARGFNALSKENPDLAKALDETGASINPAVADLVARIGRSIKEDGSIGSNQTGGSGRRNSAVPVRYPD